MSTYAWSYKNASHRQPLVKYVPTAENVVDAHVPSSNTKRSVARPTLADGQTTKPKRLNWKAKIYVGNLNKKTSEASLAYYFSVFGDIDDVKLIRDHDTKESRGFAFITFEKPESAEKAKKWCSYNYPTLDDNSITVASAERKIPKIKPSNEYAVQRHPSQTLFWEYKWSNEPDSEVYGPYETSLMLAWKNQGYFDGGCWVRQVHRGVHRVEKKEEKDSGECDETPSKKMKLVIDYPDSDDEEEMEGWKEGRGEEVDIDRVEERGQERGGEGGRDEEQGGRGEHEENVVEVVGGKVDRSGGVDGRENKREGRNGREGEEQGGKGEHEDNIEEVDGGVVDSFGGVKEKEQERGEEKVEEGREGEEQGGKGEHEDNIEEVDGGVVDSSGGVKEKEQGRGEEKVEERREGQREGEHEDNIEKVVEVKESGRRVEEEITKEVKETVEDVVGMIMERITEEIENEQQQQIEEHEGNDKDGGVGIGEYLNIPIERNIRTENEDSGEVTRRNEQDSSSDEEEVMDNNDDVSTEFVAISEIDFSFFP